MALRLSTGLRNMLNGLNTTKVVNGTFESAVTSWTGSNATLALTGGGDGANSTTDSLTITGTGASPYVVCASAIATKVNHIYHFVGYYKKGSGASGYFKIGTAADDGTHYSTGAITDAGWTKYETWFRATTTTTFITLGGTNGDTQLYDEISLIDESASIKDIFNGGQIEIRTGTQPTEADDVATGTLLVTIKNGASGITFDDSAAGVLSMGSGETWSAACVATGTAGWFRLVPAGDLGTDNTTDARIDGSVATSGGQLNFTSTAFASGATQTITQFDITMPAS